MTVKFVSQGQGSTSQAENVPLSAQTESEIGKPRSSSEQEKQT